MTTHIVLLQYILSAVQHVIMRMLLMQCIWSGTLHVVQDKENKRVKKELKKVQHYFQRCTVQVPSVLAGFLLMRSELLYPPAAAVE